MSQQKRYSLLPYGVNLFKVKAVIGGTRKGFSGRVTLLVDTGSSFTILPVQVLQQLGYNLSQPSRRRSIITGQGRTPPLPVVPVSWFNCAGQLIENFEVVAFDIPAGLQVNGLLGMDFLLSCRAVISLAQAEIYFQN
ncbi:retropepsin-like aspartic protease [Gloeothece verrucosa]|uniref:Peptidase A2A n=1 Tax=Gloeothece verrucosa (strain PCC 7822) TaxID=497965 RepID=E0UFE7_GLOV7|nr:retropepsin-like aspartic protease [Gloeothece verrucosa]ADN16641.1 hypothetical protein Cyan7822_4737 [Gloeothece verrucosa PCC 7822]